MLLLLPLGLPESFRFCGGNTASKCLSGPTATRSSVVTGMSGASHRNALCPIACEKYFIEWNHSNGCLTGELTRSRVDGSYRKTASRQTKMQLYA